MTLAAASATIATLILLWVLITTANRASRVASANQHLLTALAEAVERLQATASVVPPELGETLARIGDSIGEVSEAVASAARAQARLTAAEVAIAAHDEAIDSIRADVARLLARGDGQSSGP